jgi:hypothetical protein
LFPNLLDFLLGFFTSAERRSSLISKRAPEVRGGFRNIVVSGIPSGPPHVRSGSIGAPKSNDRHFTSFFFSFFLFSFFPFFLFSFFSFYFFLFSFFLFFWDRALKEYGSFGKRKKETRKN